MGIIVPLETEIVNRFSSDFKFQFVGLFGAPTSFPTRIYEGGAPVRTLGRGEHKKFNSPSHRLRAARSAALTVHRTVIHYRRLRFAYPLQSGGQGCAPPGRAGRKARQFEQPDKLQFILLP